MNGHDDDDGEEGQQGVEQGDVLLTADNRQDAPAIELRWRADRGRIVGCRAMANRMNDEFSRVSLTLMSPAAPRQPFLIPERSSAAWFKTPASTLRSNDVRQRTMSGASLAHVGSVARNLC